MDARPIVFFDSGVGGLPYLDWTRRRLPAERFCFLADSANFPYGTKAHDELRDLILGAVDALIPALDPKLVVVACNSASVTALDALRAAHPDIPFVGTVPAVKPAAERSRAKRIGVLATRRTVNDPYTKDLVDRFASGCQVVSLAGTDIVEFVEHRYFGATEAEKEAVVAEAIREFRDKGVDEVVLACTHFLYLADTITRLLGPSVELVDSREGVCKRVGILLDRGDIRAPAGPVPARPMLYLSGEPPNPNDYDRFAGLWDMEFAGRLGA
jgi:glutamate racemase